MKKISFLLAAVILLASCNQYDKTKSGLTYKITHTGNKPKIKQGQIVKFFIEYSIPAKDTVLKTNKGSLPGYIPVDSVRMQNSYDFPEVLMQCAEGDKMEFNLSVDSLKSKKIIPDYDKILSQGTMIHGKLDIVKVFTDEKEAKDDYNKEMTAEQTRRQAKMQKEIQDQIKKAAELKPKQIKELQDYLKSKGINAQQTPEGMFVEIQNPGTGPKVDSGMHVAVIYKGSLLNGSVFDSNQGKAPYTIVEGAHGVIPGWEIGLKYFAKGGKGRFFIPAVLGYGEQGNPPVIPTNAGLVFEIEVADVTPATPAPTMPPPSQK